MRKIVLLRSVLISVYFLLSGSFICQIQADSITGEWTRDDNTIALLHMNESSWNGTTDEVVDSSGKGNHGTGYGGAITAANGKFGRAGEFDGRDDYVLTSGSASASDVTIDMWVYESSRVVKDDNPALAHMLYQINLGPWHEASSSNGIVFFAVNTINEGAWTSSGIEIPLQTWTHLAFVLSNNNYLIYKNGVQEYSTGYHNTSAGILPVNIGRHTDEVGFFHGRIDEVRVSDVVRTSFPVPGHEF